MNKNKDEFLNKITHVVQFPSDGGAFFFPAFSREEAHRLLWICQPLVFHGLQEDKPADYPFCMTTMNTFKLLLKCIDFSLDKVLFTDPAYLFPPQRLEMSLPMSGFRGKLKTVQLKWRASFFYAWRQKPDILQELKNTLKYCRRCVILQKIRLNNPHLFF